MIQPEHALSLRSALLSLAIPVDDLWMSYVGFGGDLSPSCIESFLDGRRALDPTDYDRLVQVANELFMDRGEDHPVPYAEDIGQAPPPV